MADSKSSSSSKSSSRSSGAAKTPDQSEAPQTVTADQVAAAGAVPAAAFATVSEQEGDRSAEQKQKGLAKVAKVDSSKYDNMTLTEAAASGADGLKVAFIALVQALPRLLNVDFTSEATLAEILSGEAADRGALSPDGESPHLVDDSVLPAGTRATDDALPPNILTGDVPKGFEKHPGVLAAGGGK